MDRTVGFLMHSPEIIFAAMLKIVQPLSLVLAILFSMTLHAQHQITVKVSSRSGEPVPYATIQVINTQDTTLRVSRVSDSMGLVQQDLSEGKYMLIVESLNYKYYRKLVTVNKVETFSVQLDKQTETLKDIVVTARKPLMRQDDDKTIVDPEPIVLGSTNAYEVMEKIPGIFLDQDGNVYLNSTTPSAIWINGREQKMSGADIATMLKSLPPNSIQSIEIIRSPSARYDASGGGGIVNIVLKKGIKIGLTGSVNAGMNQGRYRNQFAGFNLNNTSGKLSTFVNVNVSTRNSFEQLRTDRLFAPDSLLSQNSNTIYPGYSGYMGFGLNYSPTDKWDLGYDARINLNYSDNSNTNPSIIQKISTNELLVANESVIKNDGSNANISQGLTARYKIDSLGSEWNNDISYSFGPSRNHQDILNTYTFPQSYAVTGYGDIENSSHFFTAQTNLVKKFKKKITVEAGLKTSNVWFNNNTAYFRDNNGSAVPDDQRTNAYNYTENIHAAYVQGSKSFGGFVVKGGVRVENTNMNGRQTVPTDTSFSIQRTDAFPYIYLSRNLMKIAGYDLRAFLVYRRSISRPSYSFLNPAIRIIDPYLFETGNPSLRPQFTQNYEANVSVNEQPILAIGFNDTRDIFSQVVYQVDSNKNVAFRTYDNLGSNKETYFRAVGAIPPGKKYFFVAGAQYNHNFYNGEYENEPLTFKRGSWSFFTYHSYKIHPNTQLSLNGFIRLNGQLQFYELGSFGSLNFNVSQQFFKKKLTVTASITDMFYTNWNTFFLKQGSLEADGFRQADTRRVGLNLRYNFGIRRKEENKMSEMPTE